MLVDSYGSKEERKNTGGGCGGVKATWHSLTGFKNWMGGTECTVDDDCCTVLTQDSVRDIAGHSNATFHADETTDEMRATRNW